MAVNIIPVSEIRQRLKDVLSALETTGEPYFVTQYSQPKAVLVRYEDYNALVRQAEEQHPRIVRHPDISGGEPVIRGTRVSVRHIIERTQTGQSVEAILDALPHLTAAQVYDAFSYYYDHLAEIKRLIEEAQPEQVLTSLGMKARRVTDGVALVRAEGGR
ncbi:MAG: type II toxin-antitoxin system prevent-host-death family antitoxin [Chloroflexi bacterium]|nr:type II toxin-antitoxin system prevent-host-death family antitoxin [Chloroflexota bacterium]